MTYLEQRLRTARHRLWLNHWFHTVSTLVGVLAGIFAVLVLVQRLYDLDVPLLWIGAGLGCGALIGSIVWATATRPSAALTAARLDEAAGLRERLSSGHYCTDADDPFAGAVLADAERVCASLSARRYIRLTIPQPFAWSALSLVVAASMFLISPGLLQRSEAKEAYRETAQLEQTRIAVKRKMDAVKRIAETSPALEDLKDELDALDRETGGKLERPGDLRHEAIKKIDKLADAVKQKRRSGDYESTREMRKMLRGLKVPRSSDAPTQKLARALQEGDFKSAREEIESLREQLATLKTEQDKELVAKISKQLNDIAKQLEKLSKNKKLAQQLEQAGIKKEDLKRLLENLKKQDLDQLKKQLEQKGMSRQQIEKLVKQLQRRQAVGSTAKRLAQAMKKGAQCNNPGQMGEALGGLSMAADQLSELELLEQEMSQLDTVLADLQNAKDDLNRPCSACMGLGCGRCQGKAGGMGRLGRGRGGLAPEQETPIDFRVRRGKVHTGKGAIIGQFLFDGEQVKGEVSSSFVEVVTAAEHEASDRINRNRIPRQYHKAVKAYFSNVQRSIKDARLQVPDAKTTSAKGDTTEESADQAKQDTEKD